MDSTNEILTAISEVKQELDEEQAALIPTVKQEELGEEQAALDEEHAALDEEQAAKAMAGLVDGFVPLEPSANRSGNDEQQEASEDDFEVEGNQEVQDQDYQVRLLVPPPLYPVELICSV
jgi:hypothetical protein